MSANVTWQEATVDRARRWQALGQQGATVWFTGLPGAGKTTIATAVDARLVCSRRCAYRLGGDNLRQGLCANLFSKSDREAPAEGRRVLGEVRLSAPLPEPSQIRDFLCFEEHLKKLIRPGGQAHRRGTRNPGRLV
jgi:hypothetical protein